jgi:hypothetical protein
MIKRSSELDFPKDFTVNRVIELSCKPCTLKLFGYARAAQKLEEKAALSNKNSFGKSEEEQVREVFNSVICDSCKDAVRNALKQLTPMERAKELLREESPEDTKQEFKLFKRKRRVSFEGYDQVFVPGSSSDSDEF